jgi:hypothetical protein
MANTDQKDYHFSSWYLVHDVEWKNQNGVIHMACIQKGGLINLEYLRTFLFIVTDIQHKNIILYFHINVIFSFQNSTDNSLIVKECMKGFFSLIMTNVKDIQSSRIDIEMTYLTNNTEKCYQFWNSPHAACISECRCK